MSVIQVLLVVNHDLNLTDGVLDNISLRIDQFTRLLSPNPMWETTVLHPDRSWCDHSYTLTRNDSTYSLYEVRVVSIIASGFKRASLLWKEWACEKKSYRSNSLDIASSPSRSLLFIFAKCSIHIIRRPQTLQVFRIHFWMISCFQFPSWNTLS